MSNDENPFASHVERLDTRQWLTTVLLVVVIASGAPRLWTRLEKFAPTANYRIPYALSDDYRMVERWCDYAARQYPCLMLGDSVIWGAYARKEETLPASLNALAGREVFANLGVDGMHPAAMLGMIRYHAASVRDTNVVINLNPLWLTSPRLDLQTDEETRFNHPGLVPQFFAKPRAYHPDFTERIRHILNRHVAFAGLVNHINTSRLDNMSIWRWTIEHPYANPLKPIFRTPRFEDDQPHYPPIPWTEKGIGGQSYPWVELDDSYQWTSFMNVVDLLKSRNNRVFVIIGPFNGHMMTTVCLDHYTRLKSAMATRLRQSNTAYHMAQELPGELYADASHPVAEGYRLLASELLETDFVKLLIAENSTED